MGTGHAILSPSAAYRWLTCTPSARFEEQLPEEGSTFAAEGTLAHELAALLLSSRAGLYQGSQEQFNATLLALQKNPLYTSDMYGHCEDYVNFVLDKGGEVLVEQSYDLGRWVPCSFGTADATNICGNVMHITDLKFGMGVRVKAENNPQLLLYALGAIDRARLTHPGNKISRVVISIFQPRAGGASSWEITTAELLNWIDRDKARAAIAGVGEFVAGEHCRFCKARTRCKAFYDQFAEMLNIRDEREMTLDHLTKVLTLGKSLISWIGAIEGEAIKRLAGGEKIPGFKLVAGRGRRSFKNEDEVVDILLGEGYDGAAIFETKLNSLTAIEKMVGAKRFKSLLEGQLIYIPGNTQLAPDTDDRLPAKASAADDFNG